MVSRLPSVRARVTTTPAAKAHASCTARSRRSRTPGVASRGTAPRARSAWTRNPWSERAAPAHARAPHAYRAPAISTIAYAPHSTAKTPNPMIGPIRLMLPCSPFLVGRAWARNARKTRAQPNPAYAATLWKYHGERRSPDRVRMLGTPDHLAAGRRSGPGFRRCAPTGQPLFYAVSPGLSTRRARQSATPPANRRRPEFENPYDQLPYNRDGRTEKITGSRRHISDGSNPRERPGPFLERDLLNLSLEYRRAPVSLADRPYDAMSVLSSPALNPMSRSHDACSYNPH